MATISRLWYTARRSITSPRRTLRPHLSTHRFPGLFVAWLSALASESRRWRWQTRSGSQLEQLQELHLFHSSSIDKEFDREEAIGPQYSTCCERQTAIRSTTEDGSWSLGGRIRSVIARNQAVNHGKGRVDTQAAELSRGYARRRYRQHLARSMELRGSRGRESPRRWHGRVAPRRPLDVFRP